jgi:hypothetical protein
MSQLERRPSWLPASPPTRRGIVSIIIRLIGGVERNSEIIAQDVSVRLRIAERRAEAEIMQYRRDQRRRHG